MANVSPDVTAQRLVELCQTFLRAPDSYATDETTREPILTFDPPLTPEEQATLANLLGLARSRLDVAPEDFATIRTNLQTLRDLRQMGRAAFMALTAAERDRLIYDALVADTVIWLAVLRD
jgi:hypothetical protein